jgi:hypothetical protein
MEMAEDLMIGARPIAAWLGQPVRVTFYMLESGQLPAFKIGKRWAVRKSTLKQRIADLESAGKAA